MLWHKGFIAVWLNCRDRVLALCSETAGESAHQTFA